MRAVLFFVLTAVAVPSYADDAPIQGAGAVTCGRWVEARKKGEYYGQLQWVQGFISSYNHYVYSHKMASGNGVFGETDYQAITVWMDNYCQRNPLDSVYMGAVNLVKELETRAR